MSVYTCQVSVSAKVYDVALAKFVVIGQTGRAIHVIVFFDVSVSCHVTGHVSGAVRVS